MIKIIKDQECCGCGACSNICPTNAFLICFVPLFTSSILSAKGKYDLFSSTTNIHKWSTWLAAVSIRYKCPNVNGLQFMTMPPQTPDLFP